MNKNLIRAFIFILAAAFITACGTDNPGTVNPPSQDKNLTFDLGQSIYYGDFYNNGSNVFDAFLLDKGLSIDNGNIIRGSGYFVYLDLNAPNNAMEIPSGTYKVGDAAPFTFQKGSFIKNILNKTNLDGSYVAKVQDDHIIEVYLAAKGSLTVSKGANYTIQGSIVSTDGVVVNIDFVGKMSVIDNITPMPQNLTKGQLWYWGDDQKIGLNIFTIRLGDNNADLNKLTGGADMMTIDVYTPLSATQRIPDGIYPVRVNSPAEQTAIDGYLENNKYLGTWYFTEIDYKITQGSLNIKYKSGNTYTLAFDFKDDRNRSITRSAFDISLGYYDKSNAPAGVKQMMKILQKRVPIVDNLINIKDRSSRQK